MLPKYVTRVQAYCRTNTVALISFTPGEVAAVEPAGIAVAIDEPYDSVFQAGINESIYYASEVVGTILEVFVWHYSDRIIS